MKFIIPGKPVPQKRARTTIRNGKALHYNSQRKQEQDAVLKLRIALVKEHTPFSLNIPLKLIILFQFEMPKSWSKKKKEEMCGKLHTSKPDISNLQKFYEDAFNKILWEDDCTIAETSTKKIWAQIPQTIIQIINMKELGI